MLIANQSYFLNEFNLSVLHQHEIVTHLIHFVPNFCHILCRVEQLLCSAAAADSCTSWLVSVKDSRECSYMHGLHSCMTQAFGRDVCSHVCHLHVYMTYAFTFFFIDILLNVCVHVCMVSIFVYSWVLHLDSLYIPSVFVYDVCILAVVNQHSCYSLSSINHNYIRVLYLQHSCMTCASVYDICIICVWLVHSCMISA